MSTPMNVDYLSHRSLKIGPDTVYFVQVNITGPVLLRSENNQHLESLICEVFVQKPECRSDSPEDLLRCAARRIEQLAKEAHVIASRETL